MKPKPLFLNRIFTDPHCPRPRRSFANILCDCSCLCVSATRRPALCGAKVQIRQQAERSSTSGSVLRFQCPAPNGRASPSRFAVPALLFRLPLHCAVPKRPIFTNELCDFCPGVGCADLAQDRRDPDLHQVILCVRGLAAKTASPLPCSAGPRCLPVYPG